MTGILVSGTIAIVLLVFGLLCVLVRLCELGADLELHANALKVLYRQANPTGQTPRIVLHPQPPVAEQVTPAKPKFPRAGWGR